jgi:uncharacterized protein YecE (DUF72 family)
LRTAAIRIGTSGWHYLHWRGPFYPPDLPTSKMLAFYTRQFDTVELNNTFYRLPPPTAAAEWRAQTPPGFLFAAKGSRFLTHMKKLKDPEAGVQKYFERIAPLGRKLGPILFQLPPHWSVDCERLNTFLAALPRGHRYAFELRDPSWHVPEVYRILRRRRAAFCIFEIAGFYSGIQLTTDFTYVRLHGPGGPYQGSYTSRKLEEWAETIRAWRNELRAIYVYFDNDQAAYAAENALALKKLVA